MEKYALDKTIVLRVSNQSAKEIEPYLLKFNQTKTIEEKRECLSEVRGNKNIMTKLLVASYNVTEAIASLDKLRDKNILQLFDSVYKYLLRMRDRATPFGCFSSVANVKLVNDLRFSQIELLRYKTHTSVSIEYIFKLYEDVINNIECFDELKVYLNPNIEIEEKYIRLHVVGENPNQNEGDCVIYEPNSVMDKIIEALTHEEMEIGNLTKFILQRLGTVETKKVIKILKGLLRDRIIYLDIYIDSNSTESINALINKIAKVNRNYDKDRKLTEFQHKIRELNQEFNQEKYKEMYNGIKKQFKCNQYFLVNSECVLSKGGISIDPETLLNIQELVELCSGLKKIPSVTNFQLENYKDKFLEKYGYSRSVRLIELFDDGEGLGSPFADSNLTVEQVQQLILYKSTIQSLYEKSAKQDNNNYWSLCHDDINLINSILATNNKSAESVDICFRSVNVNQMNIFLLSNIPTSLLKGGFKGRFDFLNNLQRKDYAGIKYYPQNSILWNVGANHKVFNQSIVINGRGSEGDILLKDIYIQVNKHGEFVLHDTNHKKIRVSANSMESLNLKSDIVKFLELIGNTGSNLFEFFLSLNAVDLQHTHRVKYKELVVVPETWRINTGKNFGSKEVTRTELKKVLRDNHVPVEFVLSHGDQVLKLSQDRELDLDIVISMLNKAGSVILAESVLGGTSGIVTKQGEQLATEFVFSLTTQKTKLKVQNVVKGTINSDCSRIEYFDGEKGWLYFKIYSERAFQDRLITSFYDFISHYNMIWFYIRYEDPKPHIRIRVYVDKANKNFMCEAMCWMKQKIDYKEVKDFSINIYERELERYNVVEPGYGLERIFWLDSVLVSELLRYKKRVDSSIYTAIVINIASSMLLKLDSNKFVEVMIDKTTLKNKRIRKEYYKLESTCKGIKFNVEVQEQLLQLSQSIEQYIMHNVPKENIIHFLDSYLHMFFNRVYGDNNIESNIRIHIFRRLKRIQAVGGNDE